jgi:hypothetical protein
MPSSEQRPSSRVRQLARAMEERARAGLSMGPVETREVAGFLRRLAEVMDADGKAAALLAGSPEGIEREIARLRETAVNGARYGVPRRQP